MAGSATSATAAAPATSAATRVRRALDAGALASGAVVGLASLAAVALVGSRVDQSFDDVRGGSGPLVEVLLTVAAVGLVAAGAVAARRCRRAPLGHAAAAAVVAVVVAEAGVVVRQALVGDPIRGWAAVAWLLLALVCGLAGGLATLRAPRLRRRADSPT